MRWLGIDLGERRTGLAISDPLNLTAQAFRMIEWPGSQAKLITMILEVIHENQITGIVMGLPRNLNGSEGPMAQKVRNFADKLQESSGLELVFWDEWLSTIAARRILSDADLSYRKQKQKVDQLAAAIVLQNFLDAQQKIKQ